MRAVPLVNCLIGLAVCLGSLLAAVGLASPATAQIRPDRTLPRSSQVDRRGDQIEITGGTEAGRNLFHSFERFSVPEGSTVFFNNGAAIESIFSRVTGRSASRIQGRIRANGSANLFLLNPNGIIFGPNASLDLGGAFVASTADRIRFADGAEFRAVNPQAAPLLTVSVPVGLQMGRDPAPIQLQGSGHGLFLSSPDNPAVDRSRRPVGLAVAPGQTLALVGGDLSLQGGNLTAAAGRIDLGSVIAGEVGLRPNGRLDYGNVAQFGDISLTQAASLEVSGNRGGVIQLQGRTIRITGTSAILADTLGAGKGGSLFLNATEQIQVAGFAFPEGRNPFVSRLSADVATGATGQGGSVTITTPRLQIRNGAQISSGTFGSGDAGELLVQAEQLVISGGSPVGPSGLFVPVEASASGNGGRLDLEVEQLQITDGAQVAATTFGRGNAGTMTVRANQVELRGAGSGLFAIVEAGASGNGGALTLLADQIQIEGGAQVTTSTAGAGNAGNLLVRAGQIDLAGTSNRSASGFTASVDPEATGRGGSITIAAEQLRLREGAQISTATFGTGAGGDLAVEATEITVSGSSTNFPSALFADSSSSGNSGNLTISTERLRIENGGQLGTASAGRGNAGDLNLNAAEIVVSGRTDSGRSGLFASALGAGAGGSIKITANHLALEDGATISVSNFSSADANRPAGQGAVGDITVGAERIQLDNQASITANSAAGDRGNIDLNATAILLRRQSAVATNASGSARGGNIGIETGILVATENSDITANATNNFGGQVTIAAEAVLGTQVRTELSSASDITASSELGAQFSGTVQLNSPDVEPNQGLVALPTNLIDASSQIAAVCAATEGNSFVVTGRGGLPEAPTQILRGGAVWEDLRSAELVSRSPDRRSDRAPQTSSDRHQVVEAQNWAVNAAGQVMLVAQTQTQPQGLVATTIDCAAGQDGPNR